MTGPVPSPGPDPFPGPDPSGSDPTSMMRLAGVGLGLLVVLLAGYAPLWRTAGGAAWVAIAVGLLHGLAMIGVAQWALGDVRPAGTGASLLTAPPATAGPADFLTMARSMTGSVCLAVTVLALGRHLDLPSWWLTAAAIPTVALDAVDGPVARRTGTARRAGGRYDLECDCMGSLVLSFGAAAVFGWWALAIGVVRYVFVVAQAFVPRLSGELPPSRFRRPAGGVVMCALVVALIPGLPYAVGWWLLIATLALVLVSFGRDVMGLLRRDRADAAR